MDIIAYICDALECSKRLPWKGKLSESEVDAAVLLRLVRIENFRGLSLLEIELDEMTVLIGENNSGKTTILEAVRLCLSRSLNRKAVPFEDHDYHLPTATSRPGDAGPLQITLKFIETFLGEWPPEIVQTLADAASVDQQGKYQISLQVRSSYDRSIRDFVTEWNFLDLNEKPNPRAKRPGNLASLQNLFGVYYLTALRDAAKDFTPRSGVIGGVIGGHDTYFPIQLG